jgi:hypothetical protein
MKFKIASILVVSILISSCSISQEIPASYSNIIKNESGELVFKNDDGTEFPLQNNDPTFTLEQMLGNPAGTENGIVLDFKNEEFRGQLHYGFINFEDAKHALPVFFKQTARIEAGKVEINIAEMDGKYDMINWEGTGRGTLGFRVMASNGQFITDGRVNFKGKGPFEVDESLILGPFVNQLTHNSVVISFRTLNESKCDIICDKKVFSDKKLTKVHEIEIEGLEANTIYPYTVEFGENKRSFEFKTAPKPGERSNFTFSYASDSRAGKGGGERDLYGANFYMVKRIMAANSLHNVAFMQFTGDLINGYKTNGSEEALEYYNWFRAIEPFSPYMPTYVGMGNHEALMHQFNNGEEYGITVDQFPFETNSAEKLFADFVTNFSNGPKSEDGAIYDPSSNTKDFPPYDETVYSYTYDNVAVIVLNSDYWYAPSLAGNAKSSGGLHGYIMDNQLEWLKKEVQKFEEDANIDHVFMTQHTPCFPNGGHVRDDMWYNGNNDFRPFVAGKPLAKGIIERRDEILDIIINQSSKVRAILTGDEHNYAKTEVGPETVIYPEDYPLPKLKLNRTIYQINNGSAGAPYYAQEQTPWTPKVTGFSTQNVLVLFDVNGKQINMRVINPDTFEDVDELKLVE